MRKRKYRKKKEKAAEENRILEKTKFIFLGGKPYLRKNKFFFSEGIKSIQRENGIFGTILTTALPLVAEILKAFK